ncbi:MAG: hypothetical protein ACYCZB_14775 [Acidiphilium sp.]
MAACVIGIGIMRAKAGPLVPSTRATTARKRAMVPNTDHEYVPRSNLARARRGIVIPIRDEAAPHRRGKSLRKACVVGWHRRLFFDEGFLDHVMARAGEATFGNARPWAIKMDQFPPAHGCQVITALDCRRAFPIMVAQIPENLGLS